MAPARSSPSGQNLNLNKDGPRNTLRCRSSVIEMNLFQGFNPVVRLSIILRSLRYRCRTRINHVKFLHDRKSGDLSQLSFSIPSLVTQTINCMTSYHHVTVVNLI